jgi:cell division protein FtsL
MKKIIYILLLVGILFSCKNTQNNPKQKKNETDSLTLQKKAKTEEIKRLKAEIDSLKKIKNEEK